MTCSRPTERRLCAVKQTSREGRVVNGGGSIFADQRGEVEGARSLWGEFARCGIRGARVGRLSGDACAALAAEFRDELGCSLVQGPSGSVERLGRSATSVACRAGRGVDSERMIRSLLPGG